MLSEIDLRDWEKVDIPRFKKVVQTDFDWGTLPYEMYAEIMRFVDGVESIMKKQVPQTAVLLKGD